MASSPHNRQGLKWFADAFLKYNGPLGCTRMNGAPVVLHSPRAQTSKHKDGVDCSHAYRTLPASRDQAQDKRPQ